MKKPKQFIRKDLPLETLKGLPRIKVRLSLDRDAILAYERAYREGISLPDLILVDLEGEGQMILAAGEHRLKGAIKAELDALPCSIYTGDDALALELALADNSGHGVRPKGKDVRQSLLTLRALDPDAFKDYTQEQLGELIGCSQRLISNTLKKIGEEEGVKPEPEKKRGKGKRTVEQILKSWPKVTTDFSKILFYADDQALKALDTWVQDELIDALKNEAVNRGISLPSWGDPE